MNIKELATKAMEQARKNKSVLKASVLGLLCGAMLVGGTLAYFTDQEEVVNKFTIGKVEIELTEPDWDPDPEVPMVPTETYEKDPQITNIGDNNAWVYMEVVIPRANIITANADGSKNQRAIVDLFTYSVNKGWTLLNEKVENDKVTRVYYYNAELKPTETTPALFDEVTFVNAIEGQQLENTVQDVIVTAKAIQVVNTGSASEAYQKLINQRG